MKDRNKKFGSLRIERFQVASDTNENVERAAPIDKFPNERKKTKNKTKKWKSLEKTMKSLLPNMLRGSWRNKTRGEKNASKGNNGSNAARGRSPPQKKEISWSLEMTVANIYGVDMAGPYTRPSYDGSNQTDPTFPSSSTWLSRSLHSRSEASTLHSRSEASTLHSRSVAYTDERSNGYQGDAEFDSNAESSRSSEESFIPNVSRDNHNNGSVKRQSESTSSSEVDRSSRSIPLFMSITLENDSIQGNNSNPIVREEKISPGDIKLGPGKPYQRHPGNIYLRNIIAANYDSYNNGGKRYKTKMCKNIVERLRLECRQFWKPAPERPGFWGEEMDNSVLRKAVASKFRYIRIQRNRERIRQENTGQDMPQWSRNGLARERSEETDVTNEAKGFRG